MKKWLMLIAMTSAGCMTQPPAEYRALGDQPAVAKSASRYTSHNPYGARPALGSTLEESEPFPEPEEAPLSPPEEEAPLVASEKVLSDLFYDHYKEWRGTRYRFGGLSKTGIDCSGFVYLTFLDRLGIQLPRSTHGQVHKGNEVARNQLQTGDLVFFRNGRSNHVGIYLEDDKFMHSSSKSGVRISSLGNSYWQRTYWKARRLNLEPQLAQNP